MFSPGLEHKLSKWLDLLIAFIVKEERFHQPYLLRREFFTLNLIDG